MADVKLGDSIAVNGCCLTVISKTASGFSADVSNESMQCTSFATIKSGSVLNLEKAMRAGDRFGGHMVSGHVDGVGSVLGIEDDGLSKVFSIQAPTELAHYIAAKGSICIDGTSLTVNTVEANRFCVNIIPHTQQETIIGSYTVGSKVNLEVDLVARYLERLLSKENAKENIGEVGLTLLRDQGYL